MAITIHPVKSCAGIDLPACRLDALGLVDDRRYQIVDGDGGMLSGREHGRLCLIQPHLTGAETMLLEAEGHGVVAVSRSDHGPPRTVRCWSDSCRAFDCGDKAAQWLRAFLGCEARLVRLDEQSARRVDPAWHDGEAGIAFSDGFPLLLLTQGSLDDLAERLGRPVERRRFRANLLIDGAPAYAEDGWRRIRIGRVELAVVKPCTRCVFVTVDPESGRRDADGEPLRTLAGYRRRDGKVCFAQNAVHLRTGALRVGDRVEVLGALGAAGLHEEAGTG